MVHKQEKKELFLRSERAKPLLHEELLLKNNQLQQAGKIRDQDITSLMLFTTRGS